MHYEYMQMPDAVCVSMHCVCVCVCALRVFISIYALIEIDSNIMKFRHLFLIKKSTEHRKLAKSSRPRNNKVMQARQI